MIKEWIFFFFCSIVPESKRYFRNVCCRILSCFFSRMEYKFKKKKYIYIYANIAMVINTWDKNREIFEKIFIRILKKRERERKTKIEDIPFTFEIVYRKINQTK